MWTYLSNVAEFFRDLLMPRPEAADGGKPAADEASQEELKRALSRLRQAWAEVAGDGALEELVQLFQDLASRGGDFKRTLVAWIDVVEIVVQDVEQLETSQAGGGARKKKLVKCALVHLLARYGSRGGREPFLLEPFVYEVVADVSIDAVVRLINRNNLWQSAERSESRFRKWLDASGRAVRRLVDPLRDWLARRIRRQVLTSNPIPRVLKKRLDAAASTSSSSSVGEILTSGLNLVDRVGKHNQLAALVEIVAMTVEEAEAFLDMPGEQKKANVRDLVLAFLQDGGLLPVPGSWSSPLVGTMIDAAIDAVVYIFNKRELFQHSGATPVRSSE